MWRFFTEFGGLPGSHLFLGSWATGSFTSLDPTGWDFLPGIGAVPAESNSSWSLVYILEQKLWVDPCCPKRSIGLLSKWGLADPETCPYAWTCNASLRAQGLIACRQQDTMGVGYFYSGLSGDLKDFFQSIPLRRGVTVSRTCSTLLRVSPWGQHLFVTPFSENATVSPNSKGRPRPRPCKVTKSAAASFINCRESGCDTSQRHFVEQRRDQLHRCKP